MLLFNVQNAAIFSVFALLNYN